MSKTIAYVAEKCHTGIDNVMAVSKKHIKDKLRYTEVDEEEEWRVSIGLEILSVRNSESEVPGFNSNELDDILTDICIN